MDEWPSHTDELSRKVSAQLDKWSQAYERGAITKREYYILITALYDATAGLVHRDLMDLMADIHTELTSLPQANA